METTQANLLWAVRDGQNTEAWGNFYSLYADMIRHFARRAGLPEADADDVTQEVLMVAHKSLCEGIYDPAKGRFRNWLYGIARRQTLSRLRERQRRTRAQWVSDRGGVDLLEQMEAPLDGGRSKTLWQEEWRYALLDEALRHIEPQVGKKAFEAFVEYALRHRPVDEVAEMLGIASSSVYVYKRRVLTAVREWIARFEAES